MKIIRGLLLIFQFALGLLLLLAYAAYYVDPLNFIWLIPLGFLLPLFLLLNVLLIPIWLLLKKKYAIISIVLILLGLPQINGLIPFKKYITPKAKCENSIKLISYNVDLFGLYKWDRNEKNKSDIFSFIEAEAPDIMCFQEYFYSSKNFFPTTKPLLEILDTKHYYQAFSASLYEGSQNFGMAIFSTFPIINSGNIMFEKTHNMCVFVDIIVDEDTLRIYNCHLQSMYFNETNYFDIESFDVNMMSDENLLSYKNIAKKVLKASKKRSVQVASLRNHMDSCKYEMIVCGDFNDISSSNTYYKLSKGLSDSFSNAGKGFGFTWEFSKIKQRIDYVLFSSGFKCKSHSVERIEFSDHFPVIVELCKK